MFTHKGTGFTCDCSVLLRLGEASWSGGGLFLGVGVRYGGLRGRGSVIMLDVYCGVLGRPL